MTDYRLRISIRKKCILLLLAVLFAVSAFCCLFSLSETKKASADSNISLEGSGTRSNPYRISSIQDLTVFRNTVNGGKSFQGLYFLQTEDIDLKLLSNFTPIGTEETYFAGIYDGGGHTISNLNIASTGDSALFSHLSGTVRNLGIESGSVSGRVAASFVLNGTESARLLNCYSLARIEGEERSGGLVDSFDGKVMNAWYYSATTDIPVVGSDVGEAYYCYGTDLAPESAKGDFVQCKEYGAFFFQEAEFIDILNLGRAVTLNNLFLKEEDLNRWVLSKTPVFTSELKTWQGEGSRMSPYLVQSVEEFVLLSVRVNAGESFKSMHFVQTVDFDLSSVYNFVPIGIYESDRYFFGTYDGAGFILTNLMIKAIPESVNNALFGQLAGTVRNLGVESGRIYGANCATIASHAVSVKAEVVNCYSKALVFGQSRSGGIVDNFAGHVFNCVYFNRAQPLVFLCSYSANQLRNCYSTGSVYNDYTFSGEMYDNVVVINENSRIEEIALSLNEWVADYAASYRMSYSNFAKWKMDDSFALSFDGRFKMEELPGYVQDLINKHYTDQLVVTKMILVSVVIIVFTIVIDVLLYRYRRKRIDREKRGK
ncbi:MAG: hypothetical protein J6D37_06060 [Clostridia bacterium]|nr:hypothetical protein [Clostridia bacterium]